ncbi:TIGR02680 family protein [Micropruina sp.]|uniref:TIGR02680 family protein n=1 Tax=Micropruina sp. TaxID=2737536 RepID=UPI002607929F|nr:TIGR02680 family protein [Micropruina sp.]
MTRWRPLRAGISNVWRYYDEVFTFEQGRLLLRGPNGSGKSKALEVLLPYLLDASTQPSRLSTFGTTARTMHWNLMGEGANGRTRVGFVWLEFGDGAERVTIGARLQASVSTTRVDPDYFITTASVGNELRLTDDQGAPLTVAALKEALGDRGKVYPKPGEYRTAVRELLFPAMTADRYSTLVQALLQLRRPKLSEHLDPEALSGLLSSALPPVDELQIAELAEGFERLDQQKAHLVQLERQEQAARELVASVRRYARSAIRRHATTLTQATSALDKASADVRHGQNGLDRQRETAAEAHRLATESETRWEELSGAKEALERSEAYAEGRNLEDLRQRVADARATADRSAGDASGADAKAVASREEAEGDHGIAQKGRDELAGQLMAVSEAAVAAALVVPGDLELPAPPVLDLLPEPLDSAWPTHLLAGLDDLDARDRSRCDQLDRLLGLLDQHDAAVAERTRREAAVDERSEQLATARQALTTAEDARDQALLSYDDAVLAWADGAAALALDRTEVETALEAARDARTGAAEAESSRLAELVTAGLGEVDRTTSLRRGELTVRRDGAQAERDDAEAERARLAGDTVTEPARAGWRDSPAAEGAPLWRLIDAAPGVSDDVLAGVEAALQASGLLDAWVLPDGEVRLDGHDIVLGRAAPARAAGSLADVLRPDVAGQPVPAEVVDGILRAIGLGGGADDAGPWVSQEGRWRFGAQHGRWTKPAAQFIGAAARERHRHERLALLAVKLADLDAQLAAIDADLRALLARADQARAEARAVPSGKAVQLAAGKVTQAEGAVQLREQDHVAAVEARAVAERQAAAQWIAVEAEAARSQLPVQRDQLLRLAAALGELLRLTADLRGKLRAYLDLVQSLVRTNARADREADEAANLRARAEADESAARRLEAELDELDATRGAVFREVVARIADLTWQIDEQKNLHRTHQNRKNKADLEIARLDERLQTAEHAHTEAVGARDTALDQFAWIMSTYLADAVELGVSVDADRVRPTLDLARQLLRDLPAERLGATELVSQMNDKVRQSESVLADRAQLELNPERDVMIPSAVHGGRRTSVRTLLDAVAAEQARTKAEITEGEMALFRRILTGDTRRHLSSRIRDAGELVAGMNRRLAAVRTSSQVRVRLVWEVRKDEGELLARARELLLTTPDRLSDADEQALARFLEERIARARETDDGLPWAQQLAKVFDYTGWHQFRVQMARGETAEWKPLTRQVHSALSGGEKAIALHLPLFAALAAHYEATPGAPRLILLDEVFVGIDTPNRGQIFGLLTELDLDLVLTSDHEWAAYPQIDGIAIHALASDDADDAVTSTRFVWTGTEMVEDPIADGMLV